MAILLFTINPDGVGRVHDILACLAKFNEDVSLEATTSELRVSSLNTSRTAHASFSLSGNQFFDKYHFAPDQRGTNSKVWTCRLQNRALSSIFWRRQPNARDGEAALERCEFELQARADQPECRLVFRLICRSGMVKTYRLTYESGEVLHATFDKPYSPNNWTVSAKTLRDVVEYFGPKTEQLDWYLQDGKVTFTSYTEKIQNGREILKQPMHTSVALERQDFNECSLENGLHIGIVVKDFRAIVAHAESAQVNVTARYSRGNRPMQISYNQAGMLAEFTLMTRGSPNMAPSTPAPARDLSVRPTSQPQPSAQPTTSSVAPNTTIMAPPEKRTSLKRQLSETSERPSRTQSPPPPTASINHDSLFIPADDDDQQWDEPNYEDDTDVVTWDNATQPSELPVSMRRVRDADSASFISAQDRQFERVSEIAPTQRLSQVKGMFD